MRRSILPVGLIAGLAVSPRAAAQQPSDSIKILEEARAAQSRYERVRMAHLAWGWSRAGSPRDEIVGRLVLLADEGEKQWRPPADPPPVVRARSELLGRLDGAADELPGDGWVAGQLVYYHVEAGRPREALTAADGCRAEPSWWCRALAGYAQHAAADFVAAEKAFDEALSAMPPRERAEWLDLGELLEGKSAERYSKSRSEARAEFGRRFWWLSDPLWSLPGNDRRTEHFARHVLERILRDARTPFEMSWGSDLREVLIRYGWPAGWERTRSRTWALGAGGRTGVIGHDAPGERRFAPDDAGLERPAEIAFSPGSLDDDGARSTYAPAYAERFVDLDHQLAVFRRGDSAFVVAGWELPEDSLAGSAGGSSEGSLPAARARAGVVEAALVVSSGPGEPPGVARSKTPRNAGALALVAAWTPAVVSVEALAMEASLAGRARYGLPLRGTARARPALSDLLLLEGAGPLPEALADAVPRARASTRVEPGEPLAVFWELYPPGGGPYDVRMSLRLRDDRGGFWKGLGTMLGLPDRKGDTVALEWVEPVPRGSVVYPRALLLRLPGLPSGEYALEIEVALPDSRRARAERRISVGE